MYIVIVRFKFIIKGLNFKSIFFIEIPISDESHNVVIQINNVNIVEQCK